MSEMSAEQVCMDGGGGTQKVESGQNLLEFHILLLLFFCLVTHFHVSSSTQVLPDGLSDKPRYAAQCVRATGQSDSSIIYLSPLSLTPEQNL